MMFFNKGVVAMMITLAAATSVGQVAATVRKTQKGGKKTGAITPAPIVPPTEVPTAAPTAAPTKAPTEVPTKAPTAAPTNPPTVAPTDTPLVDIPTTLTENDFTTLVTALTAAKLDLALANPPNEGPFTVFAPTNAAFDLLGQEMLGCLLLPAYQKVLEYVLLYHVAVGEFLAQDLFNDQTIDMANDDFIVIRIDEFEGLVVNVVINPEDFEPAYVRTVNVFASNGVVHGIDRVLVPPQLDVGEFLSDCLGTEAPTSAGPETEEPTSETEEPTSETGEPTTSE